MAAFAGDTGALVAGAYADRMVWEDGRPLFAQWRIDISRTG